MNPFYLLCARREPSPLIFARGDDDFSTQRPFISSLGGFIPHLRRCSTAGISGCIRAGAPEMPIADASYRFRASGTPAILFIELVTSPLTTLQSSDIACQRSRAFKGGLRLTCKQINAAIERDLFHRLTLNLDRVRSPSSPSREMLAAVASGLSPISTYVKELSIEPPYCCASHETVQATTADSTHAQLILTALRQLRALKSFTYVAAGCVCTMSEPA